MSEPKEKELAARLRKLATGAVEWRVQHPVDKFYCISFDRSDCINPERAAREWLADHQRRFPQSQHAQYEVAEVRCFTDLERAALDAADALEQTSAARTAEAPRSDKYKAEPGRRCVACSTPRVCEGDGICFHLNSPAAGSVPASAPVDELAMLRRDLERLPKSPGKRDSLRHMAELERAIARRALAGGTIASGLRGPAAARLRELIDRYWSLAHAEGKEGRDHDTDDGAAQQCRHEIEEIIRAFDEPTGDQRA